MAAKIVKVLATVIFFTALVTLKIAWDVKMPEAAPGNVKNNMERPFLKVVHLDLKGAPPKMSYLLGLLPVLKSAGGNGILIEYEDMFPYVGSVGNASSRMPYTEEEVRAFVAAAEAAGMEVIPLVQTFGHLEYVLKLDEFQFFREVASSPQEICPAKNDAVEIIKEMIRQVMTLHRHSRYIHIGCDEVRHIARCPVCSRTRAKKVFSRHVYRIGSFVRATYPGVIPLIWDDMMRRWSIYDVQDSGLTSVVEPVVWVYGEDIPRLVPHYMWYVYFKSFPRVWAASAFKGATGEREVIPHLNRHFDNNLSWMKFIKNRKDRVDASPDIFGGVFLTGWSRYDHFAALCELLPTGIPSLLLNLILADRNLKDIPTNPGVTSDRAVFHKWLQLLRCPRNVPEGNPVVIQSRQYQTLLGNCDFPGSTLYRLGFEYLVLKDRLDSMVQKVENSAWVSHYNFRKNFTSPWRVSNVLTPDFEEVVFKSIGMLKSALYETMSEFFNEFVINEWIEQNIDPMEDRMNTIYNNLKSLMRRNIWPRRPLP